MTLFAQRSVKGLQSQPKFEPVGDGEGTDTHSVPKAVPKKIDGEKVPVAVAVMAAAQSIQQNIDKNKPGTGEVLQYFAFTDNRTGATDQKNPLIVPESGFKITYTFKGKPNYQIIIKKIAQANNGAEMGVISDEDSEPAPVNIRE